MCQGGGPGDPVTRSCCGYLRIITAWPFPDREIKELARRVKKILVLENNSGQYYPYVRAEAAGDAEVQFLAPEILGQVHDLEYLVNQARDILQ